MNWQNIKLPDRINALPRQAGIPVPYFASKRRDGYYDLRFSDPRKQLICARKRVCWVCGKRLDYLSCFIGGDVSAKSLLFSDGPMHRECAEFSLTYCPFLATPQMGYSKHDVPVNVEHSVHASPTRSARQSLSITEGFSVIRGVNEMFFRCLNLVEQVFWKNGEPIEIVKYEDGKEVSIGTPRKEP